MLVPPTSDPIRNLLLLIGMPPRLHRGLPPAAGMCLSRPEGPTVPNSSNVCGPLPRLGGRTASEEVGVVWKRLSHYYLLHAGLGALSLNNLRKQKVVCVRVWACGWGGSMQFEGHTALHWVRRLPKGSLKSRSSSRSGPTLYHSIHTSLLLSLYCLLYL